MRVRKSGTNRALAAKLFTRQRRTALGGTNKRGSRTLMFVPANFRIPSSEDAAELSHKDRDII